ncbi:MAG: hypothetical protein Fur0020_06840 [Thermodesulfovibrionia bacterium]
MKGKGLFLILLRLSFVILSIKFVRDAFYKWDGYSYHMSLIKFLPEVSLAFILWSLNSLIIASLLFVVIYPLYRIAPFHLFKMVIERILYWLNARITPLILLFGFLFISAIPLSIIGIASGKGVKPQTQQNGIKKGRPNIILVIMDAMSAEDMELYGYQRSTTPFIKEWAREAFVFDRAYSTSNWTTPSTMSIMTGKRPWTHRVWYIAEHHPVDLYNENLAMVLKDYGYKNYAFVQNNSAHPKTLGIGNFFDVNDPSYTFWRFHSGLVRWYARFFINRNIVAKWVISENPFVKMLNIRPLRHPIYGAVIRSEDVYERFFDTISRGREGPFFAWIHLYPPHDLYLPPKPYIGMYGDAERFTTLEEQVDSNLLHREYGHERQKDVDIMRKRYDEFILYSDQAFKGFINRLEGTIDMSNTIIILTSDHGESFTHGFMGHNYFKFHEPLIHVPLIIKLPNMVYGRITDTLVEGIDIAPTILDLAGIPIPEWMEGRSLVPLFVGGEIEKKPIFSMQLIKNPVIKKKPIGRGTFAILDEDHKLIYDLKEKRVSLFNINTDHGEIHDISKEKSVIVTNLLRILEDELSRLNKGE